MHVRREARLVDDHRCGVELSLAPAPKKSSQKNRPDAPYEGLPPNRWMPGTNANAPECREGAPFAAADDKIWLNDFVSCWAASATHPEENVRGNGFPD